MATKGQTYIMSEAQKEAIRRARKGYAPKPITCKRISEALKGHEVSTLTRLHISRARRNYESNDRLGD